MALAFLLFCCCCVALHVAVVRSLHRRRLRYMQALHEKGDWRRLHFVLTQVELPWSLERALELALLRSYSVPSISSVLAKSGGFQNDLNRRYGDMETLLREIAENDADTPRSLAAIQRLNAIHAPYKRISDADMAFVLALFMCEGKSFELRGFALRPLRACEEDALYKQWMYVGRAMGIRTIEAWGCLADALQWRDEYEALHMRPAESNAALLKATLVYYQAVLPSFLHGLLEPATAAILEAYYPAQREALLCEKPPAWRPAAVKAVFQLLGLVSRNILPPRPTSWAKNKTTGRRTCPLMSNKGPQPAPAEEEAAASRRLKWPLAWGNKRYWKEGYAIGQLGPRHVREHKLVPGSDMHYAT